MLSRNRKTSPPPFYWKVPVAEKDHMTENYRRMKSIAAEGQRKRGGPLKANFVPGVTKNSKYDHIQSRVGELMKPRGVPQKSCSEELASRRMKESQMRTAQNGNFQNQPSRGTNLGGQQRLSRSSHELRSLQNVAETSKYSNGQPKRDASISASNGQRPAGLSKSCHSNVPGVKILQPNPPQESVFNWKFSDNAPLITRQQSHIPESPGNFQHQQHGHRVEYLPCDGICADEEVDDTNQDSARSSSSRTSRGCNTEETRIINSGPGTKQPFRYRSLSFGNEDELNNQVDSNDRVDHQIQTQQQQQPKQKGIFTLNGTTGMFPGNQSTMKRNRSSQNFNIITGNELEASMKAMGIRESQPRPANGSQSLNNMGAGDLPHALGKVPRYLKQRQAEWKVEEFERQEAEKHAHIPPGYALMSEEQRMENMRTFKKNYDTLIAELNRLPIRIDTIRVRDHRAQLEKQLTRLEEAMKTFSRPKVWVKVDD